MESGIRKNKLDRSKLAKSSLFIIIFDKCIEVIFPFIIRTIIIWKLSIDYLGLNSLFANILTVLSISELGFGSAAIYFLFKPIANNEKDKICALLKYYRKIYRIIGLIIFSTGLLVMPFLKYLIKGSYPIEINLQLIFFIYLFNSVISYFTFANKTVLLEAHQRVDLTTNNKVFSVLLMYISQILIICLLKNYYLYALMLPLTTILKGIIDLYLSKKMFPQYIENGILDEKSKKEIKHKLSGLLVNKLNLISRNAFDNIFISSFIGLASTAIYGNYYYIMSSINVIYKSGINSILPSIGNSIETETVEKNYKDLLILEFISMWIIGWFSACLLSLYQPFVKIWLNGNHLLPFSAVILFVLYFYILNITTINSLYYSGLGLWREGIKRNIIEACCNIVLNFVLVQYFGLHGIIIATVIPMFICEFCIGSRKIFINYFSKKNIKKYYISHFISFSVCMLICLINYKICSNVIDAGITSFFIKIVISFIVPNVLYLLIYFKTGIFRDTYKWVLSITKKKK